MTERVGNRGDVALIVVGVGGFVAQPVGDHLAVGVFLEGEVGALAVGVDQRDQAALGVIDLLAGADTARVGEFGQEVVGEVVEAADLPGAVGDGDEVAPAVVGVLEGFALRVGDAGDAALGVALEGDAQPGAVDDAIPAIGQGGTY